MEAADEHFRNGNWLEADSIYRQLFDEHGHANAEVNARYGYILLNAGRLGDALTFLQRAKRLDPLSSLVCWRLTETLFSMGRMAEAVAEAQRHQTIEVTFNVIEWLTALIANDRPRATAIIIRFYNLESEYHDEAMLRIAQRLESGDDEALLVEIQEIIADAKISPIIKVHLMHFAALLGEPELALDSFRESGGTAYEALWGPHLSDMRRTPGFKAFMRETGLSEYWRVADKWADYCHPVGEDDFECE